MGEQTLLGLIQCPTCAAVIEIYPYRGPGEPLLGVVGRERGRCEATRLDVCKTLRYEVEKRFPGHLPNAT